MRHFIQTLLLLSALNLAWVPTNAWSQTDAMESGFKRISPEEEVQLRAVLAEPVPAGALNNTLLEHFRKKRNAADRLGDHDSRMNLFRQWMESMPGEFAPKNSLAVMLSTDGMYAESIQLRREMLDAAKSDVDKEWYRELLAYGLYDAKRYEESQRINTQVLVNVVPLLKNTPAPLTRLSLLRSTSSALELNSLIQRAYGRYGQSTKSATDALRVARDALKLTRSIPSKEDDPNAQARLRVTIADVASRMAKLSGALYAARHFSEAETALKEYIRFSQEEELPPSYLSGLNQISGTLRFEQREFSGALKYFTKSDQVWASLGYSPLSIERVNRRRDIAASLAGLQQWNAALNELHKLDELAGNDPALKKRVSLPFERGLIYLGAGVQLSDAAGLFAALYNDVKSRYPAHHFFVAQAKGLQGVALWRMGDAASKNEAIRLLKDSVADYMLPDNVEFETLNVRKDARDLIFSAYLEAMFSLPAENPMDAMAPADWVRGGMVQEALADAAVRSAATSPALADLVRQD